MRVPWSSSWELDDLALGFYSWGHVGNTVGRVGYVLCSHKGCYSCGKVWTEENSVLPGWKGQRESLQGHVKVCAFIKPWHALEGKNTSVQPHSDGVVEPDQNCFIFSCLLGEISCHRNQENNWMLVGVGFRPLGSWVVRKVAVFLLLHISVHWEVGRNDNISALFVAGYAI